MLIPVQRSLGTFLALCLVAPLFAHEGDPKILDREPRVEGPGYRLGRHADWVERWNGGRIEGSIGFPAQGIRLLSWLTLGQLDGAASGNDCWGYTSGSGTEYAIIGTSSGTVFVDVGDPTNPQIVASRSGPNSLWRDIKVYQDHAYVVSEGGSGIQVFSLANIDSGSVTLVNTINDVGTSATHNVAIDTTSGFLYRTGGSDNGLRIYSLANPASPSFVGSWSTRYVHDAQVVTYTSGPFAGRQIAFCCSGFNGGFSSTGLDVLDVTNKSSIVVLANVFYPQPAYSHQGWLSPDRNWFYLGDELDEDGSKPTTTHIFDVSDPASPSYVTEITNGNEAVGHNLYTLDNRIFEANYTSGLRIFDATNPTAPVETAWFDTRPADDVSSFNGLWSVYPYLPSGVVLGSDLESGLFVWWVGDPLLEVTLPNGEPDLLDPAGATVQVSIVENAPGDLSAGSERLFYDAGSGLVEVALVHVGGSLYEAQFPAIDCGTSVSWFVSAESQNGIPWTSPEGAPSTSYQTLAAGSSVALAAFDMETTAGWTGGQPGDTATTGTWVRVNPRGTAAQPEDDHSPGGTLCWVTGQGSAGGSIGENDIDGGFTTLRSATLDLSSATDPVISYWRWYSNNQNGVVDDVFRVDVSNNGGSSWVSVEILGPNGPGTTGGWIEHAFRVADFVTPSSQVVVRFIAADTGQGSIVEAAIDDFEVIDLECQDCSTQNYCMANPNSSGIAASMGATGSTHVSADDFTLRVSGAAPNKSGLFFYGSNQLQVPFGDGFRCVGGTSLFRLQPVVQTDVFGGASRDLSFVNPPAGSGPGQIDPGSTWNFQFWFRDPMGPGGTGFNLSDGLSANFCP